MKKEKNKKLVLIVDLFTNYDKYQWKIKQALGGELRDDPDGDWLFSKANEIISEIIGCDFRKEVYDKNDPEKSYKVGIWMTLPELNNQKTHIGDGMMSILYNKDYCPEEKIKRISNVYKKMSQYLEKASK